MQIESFFDPQEIARRDAFATALWKNEQTEKVAFQVVAEADIIGAAGDTIKL